MTKCKHLFVSGILCFYYVILCTFLYFVKPLKRRKTGGMEEEKKRSRIKRIKKKEKDNSIVFNLPCLCIETQLTLLLV